MTSGQTLARVYAAENAVRGLFLELLGRDPLRPGDYDLGALVYVGDLLEGLLTTEQLREIILMSAEYREKHPETRPHPWPLRGPVIVGERGLADDDGPVIPIGWHAGDLLALFYRDRAWAEKEMDDLATNGAQFLRVWTRLADDYWANVPGVGDRRIGPWMDRYWETVADFAFALWERGLRWLVSQGDVAPANQRLGFMRTLGQTLRNFSEEVDDSIVFGVDGGNEAWQTGEADPAALAAAVQAFRDYYPCSVWSLTSPPSIEVDDINRYAGSVFDVHTPRGGFEEWDLVRYAFGAYYQDGGRSPWPPIGIASEGPGTGRIEEGGLVSVQRVSLTAKYAVMLAVIQALAHQVPVVFSSPGVSVRRRGEFREQPGFDLIPEMLRMLPQDLLNWPFVYHGGDAYRGRRTLAVLDQHTRADHAENGGRVVVACYGSPSRADYYFDRDFEGSLVRCETLEVSSGRWRAGQRLSVELPSVFIGSHA